jgi:alpha-1,3-rhamnosyl/mannosyltransferase
LVRALAELPGLELTLVTAVGDAPILGDDAAVRLVEAQKSPFSLGGMRELSGIVEQVRPDIVHCLHFPMPWSAPEVPLVVTIQDLTPLASPGVMPSAVRRAVYRERNRRAVSRAARLIVPSDATARDVLRFFPAATGKMVAIPDAADDFAAGPLGDVPDGLGLDAAPFIFTMGNTKPHKDLPTLLAAFQRLAVSRPDIRLVLAGTEPPGYLDSQLSGEPRNRAAFTGPIDDGELRALYAAATVFAFPSRYEGFGLPPLEAMALGTPVVAARAASVPEVVGDAAVLFEPGDFRALLAEIGRLLDDAELRAELARAGRERASKFSWAHTARLTAEVYAEALGESPADGDADA